MKKLLITIIIILAINIWIAYFTALNMIEIRELKAKAEFIAWHEDDYVEGE